MDMNTAALQTETGVKQDQPQGHFYVPVLMRIVILRSIGLSLTKLATWEHRQLLAVILLLETVHSLNLKQLQLKNTWQGTMRSLTYIFPSTLTPTCFSSPWETLELEL